jgi:hypothetical protein
MDMADRRCGGLAAVVLSLALVGAGGAWAQAPGVAPAPVQVDPAQVFVVDTRHPGRTDETALRFRLAPALEQAIRGQGAAAALAANARLSSAGADILTDAAAAADRRVRTAGWDQFALAFGFTAAGITLADQLAELPGFGPLNGVFTNLGLVLTAWQVTMDLSRGDNQAAGTNAWRGGVGYALARFGNRLMQVGGVSAWFLDQTLQNFGQTAWAARTDHWRQAYARYYREGEAAARQAEFGVQPILRPTVEEHLRRIEAQTTGGRSVNDWTILLWHYYTAAANPAGFDALLRAEMDRYVARFWSDPDMESWLDDSGRAGMAQGASLTDAIRTTIETEHRAALLRRLQRDVWPEIAARAWLLDMRDEAARLTREAIPELNAPVEIVVTAFGLDAPATVVLPRADGGEWRATLQPGRSRTLRMTRLAWLRAGLPDRLRLERAEGPEERTFALAETGRAGVVFGAPAAQNIVALAVTEGAQDCTQTRTHPDGRTQAEALTRPARAPWTLHSGNVAGAQPVSIVGRYEPGRGWAEAAMSTPGTTLGGSVGASGAPAQATTALFSEPRFDALAEVACTLDTSTLQSAEAMARYMASMGTSLPLQCSFLREEVSLGGGIEARTLCRSTGQMRIAGLLLPLPDGERFMDMAQVMQDSLGPEGMQQMLQGLEGMQGLPGLMPRP